NVFLIAQFWSYANDFYTEEQGERLFAIIAVGGSLGTIAGPRISELADTLTLLPMTAALLIGAVTLFNTVERLPRSRDQERRARAPIRGAGGFALVLRDRYLLLIACMLLVVNLVNTTGEFVLADAVREHALDVVPTGAASSPELVEAARREVIKAFYADFFFWMNLASFF